MTKIHEGQNGSAVTATRPYIDTLVCRLEAAGASPVVRYHGQNTTAEELLASIYRYARALAGLGIARGDLVALFAPNCSDALAVRYAANLIGAAAVYLSAPKVPQDRAELVRQLAPSLLVLFSETAHLCPSGLLVPVAAVGADVADASLDLGAMAASQASSPVQSLARSGDLAVVISSGGTTGVPKGSRRDFAAYTATVDVPSPADRRQLINGRLAYLSQVLVDVTLLGGGTVVLQDQYDAADTLAAIEAERITDLFLVEPQLFEVMDHPDVARRDLSSLRAVTHVGASAPATLRLRARERLGPVLAHTYGASEMGLVSALSPVEHDLLHPEVFTCAGRILSGVNIRFRRTDGALARPGEPGIIEVRSPTMAGGYRNRPDLEAAAFADGWYCSGDLGFLDGDGHLHVLGRAVDVAWVDGAMVSPPLIQDTLCRLPEVRYAVVVVDREAGGWTAAVVPWPGSSADSERCRAEIIARHGIAAARPFAIVLLDRVPLTEQGKPDRVAIRELGRRTKEQQAAIVLTS
ncbi:long-chain fatty acid--CoA ligase [Dankookia rubra]|uniref:Long-chain fatty acid--CoA ligase n=1 Tax=Dankookia rubra TaxID=1442381 RepID=A0A4R5QE91_9PROT|nr:AMP-binding protein [Dankookia rubra]TDH60978.1 long-chain fatty acid--CoA ligase [Dankookia rubra]